MIGLFYELWLFLVVCLIGLDVVFGVGRYWYWWLCMLFIVGFFGIK